MGRAGATIAVVTGMGGALASAPRAGRRGAYASARFRPRRPAHPGRHLRALPRRRRRRKAISGSTRARACSRAATSGAVVVPGDGKGSLLYQRLVVGRSARSGCRRSADPLTPRPDRDGAAVDRRGRALAGRESSSNGRPRPRAATRRGRRADARERRPTRRPARLLQQGRAPDPGRQLLRLPRPRSQPPADGPAARPRGGAPRRRSPPDEVAIVPGNPETSALIQRVTDPDEQKRMPHVSSGKAAPERGADRDAPPLDRAGRALGAALVVHPARRGRRRRR